MILRHLTRYLPGRMMNYAAATSKGLPSPNVEQVAVGVRQTSNNTSVPAGDRRPAEKRAPSPSHIPQTSAPESNVYILTLVTDKAHHDRMTQLRKEYFPPKLNKLEAHLTLFHALPGSKMQTDILPRIKAVAGSTAAFRIRASRPFRLKRGIAIGVDRNAGGADGKQVHRELQIPWLEAGFLSTQDSGGCQLHYTIMNKIDDEKEVATAFEKVSQQFKVDVGVVEGLGLWRYDRGFWRREQYFKFKTQGGDGIS